MTAHLIGSDQDETISAPAVAGPDGPIRQTAADRRAKPSFLEIAEATAEKFGVCKRPIPMRVFDPKTWQTSYIPAPCKSTVASVCKLCAEQARYLRMTQCREGWHLDREPVQDKRDPSGRPKYCPPAPIS